MSFVIAGLSVVFCGVLGLAVVWAGWELLARGWAAENWPVVPGRISEVGYDDDTPIVVIAYEQGGQDCLLKVGHYAGKVGDPVELRVHPDDPLQVCINNAYRKEGLAWILLITGVVMLFYALTLIAQIVKAAGW